MCFHFTMLLLILGFITLGALMETPGVSIVFSIFIGVIWIILSVIFKSQSNDEEE